MKYIYINAPWNHGENAIGCTNDSLYEGAVEVTFEEMMATSFEDKRYLGTDESLFTIPLFIKNSMQFFYFNEEEIKILLETLSNEALKNRLDKLHNLQLESTYYLNKMKKEVK